VKSLSTALKSHYAAGTTTLATCWRATLSDGTVVAATSLDRDLVIGGVTYKAAQAYNPSDIDSASELNPDNLEVEGFLASPSITDSDIHSGRWDFAQVEVFEVNYKDLAAGKNIIRMGTLGEVRGGRSKFVAELRGLMQAYTRTIVRLTTKECIADFGDAKCGIDLAAWTVTGSVGSVAGNRVIADPARIEALDHFTGGKLTFTSGQNAGLSMEVKRYMPGSIELHEPFYHPIEAGDTYSMHAGCQKRFAEDCKARFGNQVNFRGFPHLPGADIYRSGMIDYGDADATPEAP